MIVLLPGMDGTGDLFSPFIKAISGCQTVQAVRYPTNLVLSYPELEQYVLKQLPIGEPITLIAESFSGPVALRLSANSSLNLRAVVMVCSFASRPLGVWGSVLARIPLAWLFNLKIHPVFLRMFLLGNDAPDELVAATTKAISLVRADVLASRLKDVLTSRYCAGQIVPRTRVILLFSKRDRLLGKRARTSIINVCLNVEMYQLDAPHLALQTMPGQVVRKLRDLDVLGQETRG